MNPPVVPLHLVSPSPVIHPTRDDFFSSYLSYSSNTEVPTNFHRWSIITSLGAFLGRQFYFEHGSFNISPNMYTMLIGSPGTRKSTAIKLSKKLLKDSGYTTIAADKSSKEKFLVDLSGDSPDSGNKVESVENFLNTNLWGDDPDSDSDAPDCECFVMADELNDFMGHGNLEFISLLGSLWDYAGTYRNRIKTGRSIAIKNPTINILAGNTPVGFSLAFPNEILGQGFFSRILLIYGEPNGRRIAFPEKPSEAATANLVEHFRRIKSSIFGPATTTVSGRKLLEGIYHSYTGIDDIRFESYSNRRFTHLIKLCLICAAARISTEIDERDVIYANTILTHAEHSMPRALGEFGKSKNADVTHKIIQLIDSHMGGILTFKDIWGHVSNDLEKMPDLSNIIQNLIAAEKIQVVHNGQGFLPKKKVIDYADNKMIDFSLLTIEEQKMIGVIE